MLPKVSQPASQLKDFSQLSVDAILEMLELTDCADTVVGNELIRGISGGQKKRLSIGEYYHAMTLLFWS